jgi:hypothetical protein
MLSQKDRGRTPARGGYLQAGLLQLLQAVWREAGGHAQYRDIEFPEEAEQSGEETCIKAMDFIKDKALSARREGGMTNGNRAP